MRGWTSAVFVVTRRALMEDRTWVAVGLVLLLTLPGALALGSFSYPVAAAMGPEQTILDGYLRQYDRYPNLPYCGRIAPGGQEPQSLPPLPVRDVNGTNTLMDAHMAWHASHTNLRNGHEPLDDNNTYGDDFVMMHRMAIGAYDAWRAQNGHEPVAAWDPATPIPPAFAYAPPDGCLPRNSETPNVPLPAWLTIEGNGTTSPEFHYAKLCDFPTLNRLGKELDEGTSALPVDDPTGKLPTPPATDYHDAVHRGVGGDMTPPETSMRDPIFWAWHKWLDSRTRLWETECAHRTPIDASTYMDGMGEMRMPPANAANTTQPARATPSPGIPWIVLIASICAFAARRVRH